MVAAAALPDPVAADVQEVEDKDKGKTGRFQPKRTVRNQVSVVLGEAGRGTGGREREGAGVVFTSKCVF